METIKQIVIHKDKTQVDILITGNQIVKVYKFGNTYLQEVSDNIPKSSTRDIAVFISRSDYFKEYSEISAKKLKEQMKKYLKREIITLN